MNQGKTLDQVVAEVAIPADLLARPYLRPVYDDPAFVIRSVSPHVTVTVSTAEPGRA